MHPEAHTRASPPSHEQRHRELGNLIPSGGRRTFPAEDGVLGNRKRDQETRQQRAQIVGHGGGDSPTVAAPRRGTKWRTGIPRCTAAGLIRHARPECYFVRRPGCPFPLTVEGGRDIEYRIATRGAFRLVGLKTRIPRAREERNGAIAAFEASISDEDYERIEALCDQEPSGYLAVCVNPDETLTDGTDFDYYVAAATSHPAPEGFSGLDVPSGTWVVFHAAGSFPETVRQLWLQVHSAWLPSHPYRLVPGPEIVRADVSEDGTYADAELWFPVEPTS